MIVDVEWVMPVFILGSVLYCLWGKQMFIVTLVFENFRENINKIFWDAYYLPMRKSGSFVCGLGGQMTLAREENNGAKGVKKPAHDKGAFGCAYTLLF